MSKKTIFLSMALLGCVFSQASAEAICDKNCIYHKILTWFVFVTQTPNSPILTLISI